MGVKMTDPNKYAFRMLLLLVIVIILITIYTFNDRHYFLMTTHYF